MAIRRARVNPRHRTATWWTLWWAIRRQAAFELLAPSTPPASWSLLRCRLAGQRWRSTERELARAVHAEPELEPSAIARAWRAAPWARIPGNSPAVSGHPRRRGAPVSTHVSGS